MSKKKIEPVEIIFPNETLSEVLGKIELKLNEIIARLNEEGNDSI